MLAEVADKDTGGSWGALKSPEKPSGSTPKMNERKKDSPTTHEKRKTRGDAGKANTNTSSSHGAQNLNIHSNTADIYIAWVHIRYPHTLAFT